MEGKNGYVKWGVLAGISVSILGIIVSLTVWGTNQVIANDRLRASEDQRIEAKQEAMKDCMHSIDNRLGRIEERLGIPVK